MRWVAKAGGFKVLSAVPRGEALYHLIQDRLGTTSLTPEAFLHHVQLGDRYVGALDGADLAELHHVDLGAGWLPTIPFVLYSSGVERQTLLDISRHLSLPAVEELVATFEALPDDGELTRGWRRRPSAPGPGATLDGYLGGLGMRYVAPFTPESLRGAQADVITCTGVLPHLREHELPELLASAVAGLRPGGLFMAYVPLHDVYARFDRSITPFNKWRYSRRVWEGLVDSRMMRFNRLTVADYRTLLEEAGLEIVSFQTDPAGPEEVEALERTKLHPDFAGRPREDFLPRSFVVVAHR